MVKFVRFYGINDQRIPFNVFATTLTLKGKLLCFYFSTFSDKWEADYITEQNIGKHAMI